MRSLRRGRYEIRIAQDDRDLRAAQRLRWRCFVGARSGAAAGAATGLDADDHDAGCLHALIRDTGSGRLVGCFRMLMLRDGSAIGQSYSARHYDLTRLQAYRGRMAEIGRFCVDPDWRDPDILRLAWTALAGHVDAEGIELLFGCSSFAGAEPSAHAKALAWLAAHHLAPACWRPRIGAAQVVCFDRLPPAGADPRRALAAMPPLLRFYLSLGGWVSDHAVIDEELDTLHVFTGLEVRAIPPQRARLLRAAAEGAFALARETA